MENVIGSFFVTGLLLAVGNKIINHNLVFEEEFVRMFKVVTVLGACRILSLSFTKETRKRRPTKK